MKDTKFLVDEMLGKLSRWLRMLGYDASYAKDYEKHHNYVVSDDELIQICLKENRILLSRDKILIDRFIAKYKNNSSHEHAKTSDFPCLFLISQNVLDQLNSIKDKFGIKLEYKITQARCPKCNYPINKIPDANKYEKMIPKQVFAYHDEFWMCTNELCGKIFWKGTHVDDINIKLRHLRNNING